MLGSFRAIRLGALRHRRVFAWGAGLPGLGGRSVAITRSRASPLGTRSGSHLISLRLLGRGLGAPLRLLASRLSA